MSEGFAVDKGQWLAQHAAIWAGRRWPDGALLAVCAQPGNPAKEARGIFRGLGFAPVDDADAIWDLIEPSALIGHNVWISVAGYDAAVAGSPGRGRKSDIVGLPAIFVDLDLRGAEHAAGDRNPSREEAEAWIAAAPTPTVTVFSGGGFHLYYALHEHLDPTSSELVELLARHKAFWKSLAKVSDRNIDEGVLADVNRILRPAGTWNSNQSEPVTLLNAAGPSYTAAELTALLPPVPEIAKRAPVAPRSEAPHDPNPRTVTSATCRIGDRFALSVPVTELAIAVFGAVADRQHGLTFPRPDGEIAPDANARFYDDDDLVQRMTIFGSRVEGAFGTDGAESWSSFDLLAHGLGGDRAGYQKAARVVSVTEENGGWDDRAFAGFRRSLLPGLAAAFGIEQDVPVVGAPDGIEFVVEVQCAAAADDDFYYGAPPIDPYGQQPLAAVRALEPVQVSPAVADAGDSVRDASAVVALLGAATTATLPEAELTVAQAVETGTPAMFELHGGIVVYVWHTDSRGTKRHGVYKRTRTFDAALQKEIIADSRVSTWLAFKSSKVEQFTVDAQGVPIEAADPVITVTMATSKGGVRTKKGFTIEQAHDVSAVVNKLDFGVEIPIELSDVKRIKNSLLTLGADDGGTSLVAQIGSLGWMRQEAKSPWVYLAPTGSVTAAGPTSDFTVGPPPRSDEGALTEGQRSIGFPMIPQATDAIRDAARSVPAFLAITPTGPAGIAVLGAMLAAPLALTSRLTVFLAALPEVGKSKLLACVQAFLTGSAQGTSWTGGDVGKASAKGAPISAKWSRHSTSIWDDYRVPEDYAAASIMKLVVTNVVQDSYGGTDSGAKSTKGGGLTSVSTSDTMVLMSGEALPESQGILSRAISVQLVLGDVAMTPRGSSPLDEFRKGDVLARAAQEIYGAYIQWLAGKLDAAGSLRVFSSATAEARSEVTPGNGRSAEIAGAIAVGWLRFREFAVEKGFADLLPSDEEITSAVSLLAGTSAGLVAEANPASAIIRAARDMVAASDGHLELHDGTVPMREIAPSLGWHWRASATINSDSVGQYEPSRTTIGVFTEDRKHILMKSKAVDSIKRTIGLAGLPQSQLNAGFMPLLSPGSTPSERSPAEYGLNRRRGYLLPAALFDL